MGMMIDLPASRSTHKIARGSTLCSMQEGPVTSTASSEHYNTEMILKDLCAGASELCGCHLKIRSAQNPCSAVIDHHPLRSLPAHAENVMDGRCISYTGPPTYHYHYVQAKELCLPTQPHSRSVVHARTHACTRTHTYVRKRRPADP